MKERFCRSGYVQLSAFFADLIRVCRGWIGCRGILSFAHGRVDGFFSNLMIPKRRSGDHFPVNRSSFCTHKISRLKCFWDLCRPSKTFTTFLGFYLPLCLHTHISTRDFNANYPGAEDTPSLLYLCKLINFSVISFSNIGKVLTKCQRRKQIFNWNFRSI